MYKQPGLLGGLNELDQIVPPFEIVLRQAREKKNTIEIPIYHNISHWATGGKYNEGKVVVSVSVYYVSKSWFMPIPKDIGLDHIQASVFSLLNQPFPHLNKEHQETVSISGKGCAKKKTSLSYCIVIPGAEQPKIPNDSNGWWLLEQTKE